MTNSEIAVGYVVHEPELDLLFSKFFGNLGKILYKSKDLHKRKM